MRRRLLSLLGGAFYVMLDRIDRGLVWGGIDTILPDGSRRLLGGRSEGTVAEIELTSWLALVRLAKDGSPGWYEAWAAGEWRSPDPTKIFEVFGHNSVSLGETGRAKSLSRLLRRLWHRMRRNDRSGSRRNIEYHYDLGNDFYAPWLDASMTYSSALFDDPAQTLEAAQQAKLAAMLKRTGVALGDTILEIGCGWGSFAEVAARAGVKVHGITLSKEQKAFVEARLAREQLAGVTVSLTDYRDVSDRYDAVVSIEMVEAVGQEYWPAYLDAIARVLKPGGRAAIQFILIDDAIFEGYAANVDFIQRYIFPGGLLISQRRFRALAEARGLAWRDQHNFGASYAETLKRWRERFDAAVAEGRLPAEFDSRFIDLWRYYLMYCEGGFRGGSIDVAQVTLVREDA